MANANVNKVVLGSSTLIDLTADTITAENVIEGYTFHAADGSTSEGSLTHLTNAEIDEITGNSGSSVVVEGLSVIANGTYTAPAGSAYSPVIVNVPTPAPSLQSKSITPSTSQQTVQPDSGYDGLSQVTVNPIPSQYVVPSGNLAITENGKGIDVTDYATVSIDVPSGSSMNVQVAQSTTRVANTAYTETASLTCLVSGIYDVYWDCFRSTTSGTSGSQLYIDGSAYGSANTTFSKHAQNNHLTGVQIDAGQEVSVYVRSRATNYYAYCGQLTIVQTA